MSAVIDQMKTEQQNAFASAQDYMPEAVDPKQLPVPVKFPVKVETAVKRIGDLLIEAGKINAQQLQQALSESKATGKPIGSVLVKLGYVTERILGETLAQQHNAEYIELSGIKLDPALLNLLPETFIFKHSIIPLKLDAEARKLEIVIARPDQLRILDDIALMTGFRVVAKVSSQTEILNCLDQIASNKRADSQEALAKLDEEISQSDSIYNDSSNDALQNELASESAPVVQLVNSILIRAVETNASDIHMEPQQQRLLIRFRIDGILQEVESFPKKLSGPVISRVKVASGMDIAERRRPQDGRMKLKFGTQEIDMRVNTLATMYGEKIVIRLLRANATSGGLQKLGFPEHLMPNVNKLIHSPHGIILVTGPTGSGKTTTLYSCLREINTPETNITTIEDPVEYPMAGVNQTQVSHKSGLSFALCLRAILRQDPDVILVGEIRDEETLEAAIHAALTGHLVFSTLHTNSTAKTIARLLEMGAPNYMITSSVIGILAQRLVRQLCPKCKVAYAPPQEEWDRLLPLPGNMPVPDKLYKPVGCPHCNQSGYKGRVGLYELMMMERNVIDLIDKNASALAIQDEAVKNGMRTLAMDAKAKIAEGLTGLDEVTRVLGLDLSN